MGREMMKKFLRVSETQPAQSLIHSNSVFHCLTLRGMDSMSGTVRARQLTPIMDMGNPTMGLNKSECTLLIIIHIVTTY